MKIGDTVQVINPFLYSIVDKRGKIVRILDARQDPNLGSILVDVNFGKDEPAIASFDSIDLKVVEE